MSKWINKKFKFTPILTYDEMGGEKRIGIKREDYSKYLGATGIITKIDVKYSNKDFKENYYTIKFDNNLGEFHGWSGYALTLL